MEVIAPGTFVNAYDAYDIMLEVKSRADILIPLHETKYAAVDVIPQRVSRSGELLWRKMC